MEPRVPSVNGIVIPKIVLFIVVVVVALYDVCCFVEVDDADEDSRANTSDADRNMLQHQSYK
jgi:hypothetical protein